ncbi:MAG: BlaI/MecI/CopY family transcriptional regulator [Acidobacteriota bacterium]
MKHKRVKLTKLEFEVMEVLWKLGRAAIREILEELPPKRRPPFTSLQTIVNRFEENGLVERVKKIGNAYIFAPLVTREEVYHSLIDELLDIIGGSAVPLMSHLIQTRRVTLDEMQALEKTLADLENEDKQTKEANKEIKESDKPSDNVERRRK